MFTKRGFVNMKTVTLSVRVPETEAEELQRLAKQVGLDRATLLKQALRRGCAQVLFERASQAYARGEVTLSRAAEMAGVSLRELLLRLPEASVELNYNVSELAQDLEDW
jgi:predicted HTH domain antitoxin